VYGQKGLCGIRRKKKEEVKKWVHLQKDREYHQKRLRGDHSAGGEIHPCCRGYYEERGPINSLLANRENVDDIP